MSIFKEEKGSYGEYKGNISEKFFH